MFLEKGKDYCLLFNPEEKEKVYRIQDLGVEFVSSHCLAIYGSWPFMKDPRYNLYIMNLFTRERINLPSVEAEFGRIKIERTIDDMFRIKIDDEYFHYPEKDIHIELPILWIDEKTKDYVVMWLMQRRYPCLVYCRNGDNLWKHAINYYSDMVYKDHKIYLYNSSRDVKVLEFSGDIPRQIFETHVNYDEGIEKGMPERIYPELGDVWHIKRTHLVVTLTGETLRVKSMIWSHLDVWSFRIYKLNSSNTDWEKLTSLGDEAVLLDQGITVLGCLPAPPKESIEIQYISVVIMILNMMIVFGVKKIYLSSISTHKKLKDHIKVFVRPFNYPMHDGLCQISNIYN